MSKYIGRSLEWIPLPGLDRDKVLDDIRDGCVGSADMRDHVWATNITNKGTILFCYGLQAGPYKDPQSGREFNVWYVKRIPEEAGPDVYDCPIELLDQAFPTNQAWRVQVREWHAKKGA